MGQLADIFGATLCGTVIASWILGLLCVLTYQYYTGFPNDPVHIKVLVGFLLVIQILNQIVITKMNWHYLITSFGNGASLESANWEWSMFVGLSTIAAFSVQMYYARRVFLLSKSYFFLLCVMLLALGQLAFGLGTMIYTITLVDFDKFTSVTWICVAWLGCSAGCDVVIAGVQVWFLMVNKSPMRRTRMLVKRLLIYIISTGSLTSIVVLVELSTFAALGFNFAHVFLSYSTGGVYTLSLLANLLVRKSLAPVDLGPSDFLSAANHMMSMSIRFRPGTVGADTGKEDDASISQGLNEEPSHHGKQAISQPGTQSVGDGGL